MEDFQISIIVPLRENLDKKKTDTFLPVRS